MIRSLQRQVTTHDSKMKKLRRNEKKQDSKRSAKVNWKLRPLPNLKKQNVSSRRLQR